MIFSRFNHCQFRNISGVVNRRTGQIFHAFYGNSHTKTIGEIGYAVKLNKIKCESKCSKSVRRMASEFGISNYQIFVSEFLILHKKVHFE